MNTKNLFELAVSRGETEMFFKGEGAYFVRDPDWGVHVYAAHYGGHVHDFVFSNPKNQLIFEESFIGFVRSLKSSQEDADHFFGNLSAIVYWKKSGKLKEVLPLKNGTCGQVEINGYISELLSSDLCELEKGRLRDQILEYIADGYSLFRPPATN